MNKNKGTIHILGAGIAGLACAFYALKKFPHRQVVVYEAANHPGGRCYSFFDEKLGCNIDNATHGIIKANSRIRKFLKNTNFGSCPYFYDLQTQQLNSNPTKFISHILLSMFNTSAEDLDLASKITIFRKMFPFILGQSRLAYSQGNLTENLLDNLLQGTGEIKTGWKLQGFEADSQRIQKLIFNHGEVKISSDDMVVSALDAHNYQKIFGGNEFEFNRIINIFYRTSVRLTLPQNRPVLGIINGLSDWLFVNDQTLGVTISNASHIKLKSDELAREIWKEVCRIRKVEAAFVPTYRVLDYKRATIRQDKKNNALRPSNCQTRYKNLLISGDWTMKNYPCSLEATVISAKRAVKSL